MSNNIDDVKVQIILPNYNSAPYLEETINSIINQTFENWNLTIVDGNSDNETQQILKKYVDHKKINIIFLKKNKKAGFCRNLAIRKSESDYIAFIDSDDLWEKGKLFKQLDFMIKKKHYFTYTNYQPFINGKKYKEIAPEIFFTFEKFIKNTSIGTSTMIIKRSIIGNTKFSNTKICEDYFFKCQILKKVKCAYCLPESLTKYRIRKGSLQSNKLRNLFWIWKINYRYNKLSFFENLNSLFFISFNSIKKYGLK